MSVTVREMFATVLLSFCSEVIDFSANMSPGSITHEYFEVILHGFMLQKKFT